MRNLISILTLVIKVIPLELFLNAVPYSSDKDVPIYFAWRFSLGAEICAKPLVLAKCGLAISNPPGISKTGHSKELFDKDYLESKTYMYTGY